MPWYELPPEIGDLGDDEALGLEFGGQRVALCRSRGTIHAVDNVCTHQFALLSEGFIEDGQIECPLHQGRFDLQTGAPACAPVTQPIRVFALRFEHGKGYVEIPE